MCMCVRMCVCMYACMHGFFIPTYIYTHIHTLTMKLSIAVSSNSGKSYKPKTHMHTNICSYIYTHIHKLRSQSGQTPGICSPRTLLIHIHTHAHVHTHTYILLLGSLIHNLVKRREDVVRELKSKCKSI
jgi:hypothetical protein